MKRIQNKIKKSKSLALIIFIITGLASTIWFLIRVIPKPSRASYPCMKAAAPLMSGFVIYLLSLSGAVMAFKGAGRKLRQAKYIGAFALFFISVVSAIIFFIHDTKLTFADTSYPGPIDGPNLPMGAPHGIMPGRVAWAWNPNAVNQNQTGTVHTGYRQYCSVNKEYDDLYFMPENNNQGLINRMMSSALMSIANDSVEANAWNDIFMDFNNRKGLGPNGYQQGEIIYIKINMTGITFSPMIRLHPIAVMEIMPMI